MNISVFLISTTSQAFFLDQARKIEPDSVLIITTSTKKKKDAILEYLSKYKWARVIFWKIPHSKKKLEYWKVGMIQLECLKFVLFNKSKIDRIFIGSYANIFHKNFISYFTNGTKINLIYDGLQVLAVSENRMNSRGEFKTLPFLYKLLFFKNTPVRSLNYLVPFNFKIPINDSIEVFQIDQKVAGRYDQKLIYFIGQPLESIKAVSEDYYLRTLKKFVKGSIGKNVFYIPHPREKRAKIEAIANICEVFAPGKVFEEYFLETIDRPLNVASFYSSVLLNLYAIDKNVNLISISIPYDKLLHPRFENILKPIYRSFGEISEERFQIINLS